MHVISEYDAFGPWIYEVHNVDELPRLYQNAGIDPTTCSLVLKIPRNIERRDATPDMHLYDHLVSAAAATSTTPRTSPAPRSLRSRTAPSCWTAG